MKLSTTYPPFRFLLATMAAIAAPAFVSIVLMLLDGRLDFDGSLLLEGVIVAVAVSAVSMVLVLFLGVPIALIFASTSSIKWWNSSVAGFVIGAIPAAILAWPDDGKPSGYRWMDLLIAVSYFGVHGAASGLAFWAVWRTSSDEPSSDARS